MVEGGSCEAFVTAKAHISVHEEIQLAVVLNREDFDFMVFPALSRIVFGRVSIGKDAGVHVVRAVIAPELPAGGKGRVAPRRAFFGRDAAAAADSKRNPLPGEEAAASREQLVRFSLVIHHIDALGGPFHREGFCDGIEFLTAFCLAPEQRVHLDDAHVSINLF